MYDTIQSEIVLIANVGLSLIARPCSWVIDYDNGPELTRSILITMYYNLYIQTRKVKRKLGVPTFFMIIDAFFQLGFRITELHAGSLADVLETVFFPIDLEIPAKIFERVLKNRMCIEYILQRLMNITQSIS